MAVIGIGTDIVEVNRIREMNDSAKSRLAKRVLTPRELAHYQSIKHAEQYLAKRWAAKEAAAKALGSGIADGVSFQHFDIISLSTGQPQLQLSSRALELATSLGASSWHISIADERMYATAFVVLSA